MVIVRVIDKHSWEGLDEFSIHAATQALPMEVCLAMTYDWEMSGIVSAHIKWA